MACKAYGQARGRGVCAQTILAVERYQCGIAGVCGKPVKLDVGYRRTCSKEGLASPTLVAADLRLSEGIICMRVWPYKPHIWAPSNATALER